MDDSIYIAGLFLLVVASLGGYAIKRNFDENQAYIVHGYHQVSGTNSIWVKE